MRSFSKTLTIALLLVLASASSVSASIIGKPTNNLGLLAYFPMNEGSGNRTTDATSNKISGVFANTGGNPPVWVQGRIGTGIQFDGASNYLTMGDVNSLDGLSALTVSAWIKSIGSGLNFNSEAHWVDKSDCTGGAGDGPFELYEVGGSNHAGFTVYIPAGSTGVIEGATNIDDGNWHLVQGVYNGTTASVWVDGRMENSVPVSGTLANTSRPFNFGGYCANNHLSWAGTIDDVRVYNRAFSATESVAAYATSTSRLGASSVALQDGSTLGNGLVGLWTMDGADITTSVRDKSGSGNNGGFIGTATTAAKTLGIRGQALNFNGTSNYIDAGPSIALTSDMTACAWVNASSLATANERHIFSRSNVTNDQFGLYALSTGKVGMVWGPAADTGKETNSAVVTTNAWYHVCGTRSTTAASIHIYINGAEVAATSLGGGSAIPTITANTAIGSYAPSAGCSDCYWKGKIDDARLYNRALSAAEVKQLYSQGSANTNSSANTLTNGSSLTSGLVAHWTFDGADTIWTSSVAATTADKSGNANTGTLNSMARSFSPVIGKMGQAFTFDGAVDYIAAADSSSLDVGDVFTYALWVRRARTGVDETLFSKSVNSAVLGFDSSNRVEFCGHSLGCPFISTATITDTNWHHLIVTKSGSVSTLYIDGALSTTTVSAVTMQNGVWDEYIGSDNGANVAGNFFKGSIDDFRIYNRAITATEAKQLYNLGR